MQKPYINFIVLDYNRPNESFLALQSIKENAKFKHRVIYLSNGGPQDYVWGFYQQGLIDDLILKNRNSGYGFGTTDLYRYSYSDYSIYVQCDQALGREMSQEEIDHVISLITPESPIIGLAGDQNQGAYSDRAHITYTPFYNKMMENAPNGGPGPYWHLECNEGYVKDYLKEKGLSFIIYPNMFFIDNGCFSMRENPDGSLWRHRTDLKTLDIIKKPTEIYNYPDLTPEEWQTAIDGKWVNGAIPERWKAHSFQYWK